jgi:hypothetical protein
MPGTPGNRTRRRNRGHGYRAAEVEPLDTLPANDVPLVTRTVCPSTVIVLVVGSTASTSPRTALVKRSIVAVPLSASISTVMPTCRSALEEAASSLSPSSTCVCMPVANSRPLTNTLPKPVITPLAPIMRGVPDEPLEDPPPHATRIVAASSATPVPAIKVVRFIALASSFGWLGDKTIDLHAVADNREFPAGPLIPSKDR